MNAILNKNYTESDKLSGRGVNKFALKTISPSNESQSHIIVDAITIDQSTTPVIVSQQIADKEGDRLDRLEKKLNDALHQLRKVLNENEDLRSRLQKVEQNSEVTIRENEQRLTDYEKRCNNYERVLKDRDEELLSCEDHVNGLEQYTRRNNVVISGVPVSKDENVTSIVQNCARAAGFQIQECDIDICHRLPQRKSTNNPPNIVVKFVRRTMKNSLIAASKKNKPRLRNIGLPSDDRIFFAEHLSPRNADLHYRARLIQKEHDIRYIWTKEGRVMARVQDGETVIKITTESDLQKLVEKSVKRNTSQRVNNNV